MKGYLMRAMVFLFTLTGLVHVTAHAQALAHPERPSPDTEIIVQMQNRGCFSSSAFEAIVKGDRIIVTKLADWHEAAPQPGQSQTIPITPEERAGLENYFELLRNWTNSNTCTTKVTMNLTYFEDGNLKRKVELVDGDCLTTRGDRIYDARFDNIVTLNQLVSDPMRAG